MLLEKPFRVAILPTKYVFEVNKSEDGLVPNRGIEVKFLEVLSQCMHFKYTVVQPQDGEYGQKLDDGWWTGMIGLIVRQKADFALNMIASTQARREVVDFSFPYSIDGTTFFTGPLHYYRKDWHIFIHSIPFCG
ncbi:putative glutamate receptor [Caerostris darwini]|uniref:Glutamate receptor n=1 Tax=Caerostris darwini TaxID=1538125 RepID=A0AAV4TEX0_9ARAC|nr:putative glutamate receptor [Caerostris darwini]